MKINKGALQEALKAIMPGIAAKELIEQSSSVVFINNTLVSFNDEVAVSYPFVSNFTGAVPAKELLALVNKAKTEEISLEVSGAELIFKSGKSKAGLRLEHDIHLPLEAIGEPSKWTALPDAFCRAVQFCLFTAGRDEQKPVLTCVHVVDNYVETSDNQRITRFTMGGTCGEELLIPASAARDALAYKPTDFSLTNGWLHFINDKDVMFSCRCFEEVYPDLGVWLTCSGETITFPKELPEILDRADVMSDGDRVGIILENDSLVVATEKSSGWFEEDCSAEYKGDVVEFDIQPEFMKSILKITNKATLGEHVLKFEGADFVHVVWLMEPKNKK